MGACLHINRSQKCDKIFKDIEWSSKGEDISGFFRADTLPSCSNKKHNTPTNEELHKNRSSIVIEKFGASGSTYLLPNLGASGSTYLLRNHGATRSSYSLPNFSSNKIILEAVMYNTTTSATSLSFFWGDSVDIVSYDGVNKRICNRYDIGLRMLKAQIQYGADPNVLTTHGDRSCLMFATLAEDFAFVKHLVELGVDVNKTNISGETALNFALALERKDIADFLRANGAVDDHDIGRKT